MEQKSKSATSLHSSTRNGGKTFSTVRTILSLERSGAWVRVTSNSHEAVRNVPMGCLSALEDKDLPIALDLVHKTSGDEDGYPEDCPKDVPWSSGLLCPRRLSRVSTGSKPREAK